MEARIVRDELQKCYKYEGVNNVETCHDLAQKYTSMIRDNKVGLDRCRRAQHAGHVPLGVLFFAANTQVKGYKVIDEE